MNIKIIPIIVSILLFSCNKNIDYSSDHIEQTSGRYLYNPEEVIDVYYQDNQLYLKWKGASKIKPVVLDENTFFVPDMYQKLRFAVHPQTNKRYLAVVDEEDDSKISYDYEKVADDFSTPWMYLNNGNYDKASEGYLALKAKDSTTVYIEEHHVNRIGYDLLREKKHEDAIKVFTMNTRLYPESDNVYDSLADAYMRNGDTLNALINYRKAYELNTGNQRAKDFIKEFGHLQN